jgi:hypothetical protein
MNSAPQIPSNQELRRTIGELTRRGSQHSQLLDPELHWYLTNLLLEFVHVENVFKFRTESLGHIGYMTDVFGKLEQSTDAERRELYRHMGDYILFVLGVFPESLKRCMSRNAYAELGRRSYLMTSKCQGPGSVGIFRKLFEQFQNCVNTLNWVRDYTRDPFYQYMFRQFDVA